MVALASSAPRKRAPWAWLVALALCLVGCGEDAEDMEDTAAAEEPQSTIAFVSGRDGHRRIYVMDPDGGRQRPLTTPEYGEDTQPVWLPDGSTLAFISTSSGATDIHLVDASGSNRRNLTDSSDLDEATMAWSPDGARMAYAARGLDTDDRVYIQDLVGARREDTGLEEQNVRRLGWSPDGASFVYAWQQHFDAWPVVRVVVRDVDGEGAHPVDTGDVRVESPVWSPTGHRIAMAGAVLNDHLILVTNARGTNRHTYRVNTDASTSWPTWSPDEREIAYADDREGLLVTARHTGLGRSDIWVVNLENRTHRQLTHTRDYDGMPAWSP